MTEGSPPLTKLIGEAERGLRSVLDGLLADAGRSFEEWTLMSLLARSEGPVLLEEALRRQRAGHLGDETATLRAIEALVADGVVVREGDSISLTEAGRESFGQVRQEVTVATDSIFAGVAPGDLEATRRVLSVVAARTAAA